MRRRPLGWIALGIVIGIAACALVYVSRPAAPRPPEVYFVLHEPAIEPPPPDPKVPYIENLRHRDFESFYVGTVFHECGVDFETQISMHSLGEAFVDIRTTAADKLECVLERAKREQLSFEFRQKPDIFRFPD